MVSDTEIRLELKQRIDDSLEKKGTANPSRIVLEVVAAHKGISGKDVDWYTICAHGFIRSVLRGMMRDYNKESKRASDPQLVMPGFERVQKAYLISRDDEQIIVKTELLTRQEIAQKVDELRRMAKGCELHADELERYGETRPAKHGKRRSQVVASHDAKA